MTGVQTCALPISQNDEKKKNSDIILIGFMGAGKTTVGQALAQTFGLEFADTDQLIEKQAGKKISEIFSEDGEETFRRMETELLEELVRRKEVREGTQSAHPVVYSVGGGLPMREENRRLLKRLGRVFYLTITPDTVLERLQGDTTRPLLAGEHVRERVEGLLSFRDPMYREACHVEVAADRKDLPRIVEEIMDDFRRNQA